MHNAAAKVISFYLLFAISFKRDGCATDQDAKNTLNLTLAASVIMSALLQIIAYVPPRALSRIDRLNAAAEKGHFSAISIITFVVALSMLEGLGIPSEGSCWSTQVTGRPCVSFERAVACSNFEA